MKGKNHREGYFKAPNFVFDLPIHPLAKLILIYFCRRADLSGVSFPSIKRISMDTGIKSKTSISKYIRELIELGYVKILKKGKTGVSNRYQLSEAILNVVLPNKEKPEEPTRSKYDHPTTLDPETTPPNNDHPWSNLDLIPGQNMTPKEYSFKEDPNKEYTSAENEKDVFAAEDSKDIYISFSPREKEYGESPTHSRDFGSIEEPAPAFKKQYVPNPAQVSDESSPHRKLTRRAVDPLSRRAQGEPEVSDNQGKRLQDLMERKNDVSHDKLRESFSNARRNMKSNSPNVSNGSVSPKIN